MRINEIAFSKPLTPEQQRLAGLKDTKERANQALAAERKRQQVSAAQKKLQTIQSTVINPAR